MTKPSGEPLEIKVASPLGCVFWGEFDICQLGGADCHLSESTVPSICPLRSGPVHVIFDVKKAEKIAGVNK